MPFDSDKQRAYLWANKPEVAKQIAYKRDGGGIYGAANERGFFNELGKVLQGVPHGITGGIEDTWDFIRGRNTGPLDITPERWKENERRAIEEGFGEAYGGGKIIGSAIDPLVAARPIKAAKALKGVLAPKVDKSALSTLYASPGFGSHNVGKRDFPHVRGKPSAFHPDWDPKDPRVDKAIGQIAADTAVTRGNPANQVGGVTTRGSGGFELGSKGDKIVNEEFAVDPEQWAALYGDLPPPIGKPVIQLAEKSSGKLDPFSVVTDIPGGHYSFNPHKGEQQFRKHKSKFGSRDSNRDRPYTVEDSLQLGRDKDFVALGKGSGPGSRGPKKGKGVLAKKTQVTENRTAGQQRKLEQGAKAAAEKRLAEQSAQAGANAQQNQLAKLITQAGTEKGLSNKQASTVARLIAEAEAAEDYATLEQLAEGGLYNRGGRVGPLGRCV